MQPAAMAAAAAAATTALIPVAAGGHWPPANPLTIYAEVQMGRARARVKKRKDILVRPSIFNLIGFASAYKPHSLSLVQ